jgi:alpha-mannosidase
VATPFDPAVWIEHLEPSQTWYSYVMNNYWETNYKASQDGPTRFRYSLAPHRRFDQAASARFGIERGQPMVVVPVKPDSPAIGSRLRVEPTSVILASMRPTDDGQALLLRLFNASDGPQKATLHWSDPAPPRVTHSSPRQEAGDPAPEAIELPAMGIVTLRAEVTR